jgi:hypothetical protein
VLLQLAQILLRIGIAIGSGTAEAVESLLLLATKPIGGTQSVQGTLVAADCQQQTQRLMVTVATVGGQQFAGFIDDLGIGVGDVVVVDTDVSRVTLVAEDVLLDVIPRASAIHSL